MIFYMMTIAVWELAYRFAGFPSPLIIVEEIRRLSGNNTLGIAIFISLKRLITGYFISLSIGLPLGVVMTKLKHSGKSLSKIIAALQTMPNVCWVPFAILWYGTNEKAILFVIVIGSVFAISMATESGIKNLNPTHLRVAKMSGARGYMLYKDVIIPAALPAIISGLKQGWAFAWRGLIAGEMIGSSMNGLGQILGEGRKAGNINQIVAVMLVIILLGLLFDKFVFDRIQETVNRKFGLTEN